MNSQDTVLALSTRASRNAWSHRPYDIMAMMSDDVSFVGPFRSGVGFGREDFLSYYQRLGSALRLLSPGPKETHVALQTPDVTVVLMVGDISDSRGAVNARIRSTLCWRRREDDSYELVHIHVSIPTLRVARGQVTELDAIDVSPADSPASASGGSAATTSSPRSFLLKDSEGTMRMVPLDDIIYIEASHQYVIIHTDGAAYRVRTSLTQTLERLSGCFVRVHRSFAVNAHHVVGVRGTQVLLSDGRHLNMPAKRAHAVREELARAREL